MSRTRRRLFGFAAATLTAAGAAAGVTATRPGPAGEATRYAFGAVLDQDCGNTSNDVRKEVDRVLSRSNHPDYPDLNLSDEAWEAAYEDFAIERAAAHGLTLVDYRPYASRLQAAQSISSALRVFNQFTSNYGIRVELYTTDRAIRHPDQSVVPIDVEVLDLERFRAGVARSMQDLFNMPKELVALSEVRSMRIVDSFRHEVRLPDGTTVAPAGTAEAFQRRVNVGLDSFNDGVFSVTAHEFGHHLGYRICGVWGVVRDDEILDLHPENFRYGTEDASHSNLVMEPYGANNKFEDDATVMETILNGLDASVYLQGSETQREKLEIWLSRIESRLDGYAGYVRDLADENNVPPLA